MALWQSSKLLCFMQIVAFSDIVHAYYCEWNLCDVDQYCCGDNQCCSSVYNLWYFWAGIVFLIIMLSSCGGLFRYCFTGYRPQIIVHQITNFVPFPTERACPEERQPLINDDDKRTLDMPIHDQGHEDVEASLSCPDSPPPPYTASIIPGKALK